MHYATIIAYLDYLRGAGFSVTLHGDGIVSTALLPYNYHQNPLCHYVKNVCGGNDRCYCQQKKVLSALENGSRFGCCFAGVGEFVYPVKKNDAVVGFVSVSGYATEQTAERLKQFSANGIDLFALANRFLTTDIPEKSKIDAVIDPLVFMLEARIQRPKPGMGEQDVLFKNILHYLLNHCHDRVTMAELAERFHCSVSTLSHLFAQKSGKSLPAFMDDLRLTEAKWYLLNSDTSVAEIARFLGYASSQYFATAFRRRNGITPKQYQKEHRGK